MHNLKKLSVCSFALPYKIPKILHCYWKIFYLQIYTAKLNNKINYFKFTENVHSCQRSLVISKKNNNFIA